MHSSIVLSVEFFSRFLGFYGATIFSTSYLVLAFLVSLFIFYEVAFVGCFSYINCSLWISYEVLNVDWGFMFDSFTGIFFLIFNLLFVLYIYYVYENFPGIFILKKIKLRFKNTSFLKKRVASFLFNSEFQTGAIMAGEVTNSAGGGGMDIFICVVLVPFCTGAIIMAFNACFVHIQRNSVDSGGSESDSTESFSDLEEGQSNDAESVGSVEEGQLNDAESLSGVEEGQLNDAESIGGVVNEVANNVVNRINHVEDFLEFPLDGLVMINPFDLQIIEVATRFWDPHEINSVLNAFNQMQTPNFTWYGLMNNTFLNGENLSYGFSLFVPLKYFALTKIMISMFGIPHSCIPLDQIVVVTKYIRYLVNPDLARLSSDFPVGSRPEDNFRSLIHASVTLKTFKNCFDPAVFYMNLHTGHSFLINGIKHINMAPYHLLSTNGYGFFENSRGVELFNIDSHGQRLVRLCVDYCLDPCSVYDFYQLMSGFSSKSAMLSWADQINNNYLNCPSNIYWCEFEEIVGIPVEASGKSWSNDFSSQERRHLTSATQYYLINER